MIFAQILQAALLLATPVFPQTTMDDVFVWQNLGVGTEIPRAALHIQLSSSDVYGLIVSSGNGQVLAFIDADGRALFGTGSSSSRLTIGGTGDSGDLALLLRSGASTTNVYGTQIAWIQHSTNTNRHNLQTRSSTSTLAGNAMDFYLWRTTSQPNALGTDWVLSMEASVAASSGSFHVVPATGVADAEVEVSNGSVLGGGIVRYGSSGTPSSRKIKSNIVPLSIDARRQAYEDVKGLRHVSFQYRGDPSGRTMRGLVFEDAPRSVQGSGGVVVLDERLLNLEMALQEVETRARELEAKVRTIESRRSR